ncbi:MAG: hypothetical protein F6K56_08275 [Moorea sp. SIO3G5]|nr:hypothetical protein [Moorena sp. SIO3G5]
MVSVERVGVKSSGVVSTISDCVNIGIVRKLGIGNAIAFSGSFASSRSVTEWACWWNGHLARFIFQADRIPTHLKIQQRQSNSPTPKDEVISHSSSLYNLFVKLLVIVNKHIFPP